MKENGMEKLIELLNEYLTETKKLNYQYEREEIENHEQTQIMIISKKFGFIQWLVDSDKIHCGKAIGEYGKTVGAKFISEPIQYNDFVCICLMLLSIQDKPIEFLISILK